MRLHTTALAGGRHRGARILRCWWMGKIREDSSEWRQNMQRSRKQGLTTGLEGGSLVRGSLVKSVQWELDIACTLGRNHFDMCGHVLMLMLMLVRTVLCCVCTATSSVPHLLVKSCHTSSL